MVLMTEEIEEEEIKCHKKGKVNGKKYLEGQKI